MLKIALPSEEPQTIRLNPINHFKAKNGRLKAGVPETLFHFCEEDFEEIEDSGSEAGSEDEEIHNKSAESQHMLGQNVTGHCPDDKDLGF